MATGLASRLTSSICGMVSGRRSTSVTFIISTAWCAVIARPDSDRMRGCGMSFSAQNSCSIDTITCAYSSMS
ncbi:hypothetical protein D3C85_1895460 [compost metagenome]